MKKTIEELLFTMHFLKYSITIGGLIYFINLSQQENRPELTFIFLHLLLLCVDVLIFSVLNRVIKDINPIIKALILIFIFIAILITGSIAAFEYCS